MIFDGIHGVGCRADVASQRRLLWEGYMGVQEPALLFRTAVNLERASKLREELLSTGCYVLADVTCRACLSPLGWSYLHASNEVDIYCIVPFTYGLLRSICARSECRIFRGRKDHSCGRVDRSCQGCPRPWHKSFCKWPPYIATIGHGQVRRKARLHSRGPLLS